MTTDCTVRHVCLITPMRYLTCGALIVEAGEKASSAAIEGSWPKSTYDQSVYAGSNHDNPYMFFHSAGPFTPRMMNAYELLFSGDRRKRLSSTCR